MSHTIIPASAIEIAIERTKGRTRTIDVLGPDPDAPGSITVYSNNPGEATIMVSHGSGKGRAYVTLTKAKAQHLITALQELLP
jgi:hypothetical protein